MRTDVAMDRLGKQVRGDATQQQKRYCKRRFLWIRSEAVRMTRPTEISSESGRSAVEVATGEC
jgi:hypothetical protein